MRAHPNPDLEDFKMIWDGFTNSTAGDFDEGIGYMTSIRVVSGVNQLLDECVKLVHLMI